MRTVAAAVGVRVAGRAVGRPRGEIRLADTRRLGRMVRWRIPGLDGSLRYHELFRSYPFMVLEECDHGLGRGLCGRIWTLTRDYPPLAAADEFARWREPGTVRVAFDHRAVAVDGGAEIVSEARVEPVDTRARLRLKAVWAVLGPFAHLVASRAARDCRTACRGGVMRARAVAAGRRARSRVARGARANVNCGR